MSIVLAIDDDQTVLQLVHKAIEDSGANLLTAQRREGLDAIRRHSPDVLLLDISLPDASGLELIGQVRVIDPKLPIAFITVSDDSHTAIEAMKCGAYDFLIKPLSLERVRHVVKRALETRRLMEVPVKIPELDKTGDEINEHDALIGHSPAMLDVYKEIGRIATQDVSVLICGESGTGKELVARAIYQHSSRRRATLPGGKLHRAFRHAAGERVVRARKGGLYRSGSATNRKVRAMPRRHYLPGRGGRHVARYAE